MPRTGRSIQGGLIYHVLNRGNARMTLFHKEAGWQLGATVTHQTARGWRCRRGGGWVKIAP